MNTTKSVMAVSSTNSPGVVITLESTGIFLGILVSGSVLAGVAISVISKMNRISFLVNQIQETLKNHASNAEKIKDLDKRFDIHLQDYINHKDATLLALNGNDEKIDHKWERTEELFKEIKVEIKELQQFLQKQQNFKIRE
ncbi:hypothetical protein [Halotia branconii]|uniref:Uncharacterized protein n=1 Tax=Halotia branconii CENA392 TaxID=1539056 RepID=A0AAJ6NQY7_9CYAN|nr:hypothetical protein [Halotia branconii]WGV24783.1 hypothetical protein QI031_23915 [Halotia branconii CENA392]